MGYKRKKFQHQILKILDDWYTKYNETPGTRPDGLFYYKTMEQISQEIRQPFEKTKVYVFELIDRKLINYSKRNDGVMLFCINVENNANLYSEKLLREYDQEYNKFWLTVLQYAFYIITIIVSIVTLSKATTSKESQECKPKQEQISCQKKTKN